MAFGNSLSRMSEDFRNTWGSEQWVLDRLVEAVESGDPENKLKLATHLLDGYSRHDWKRRVVVGSGIILLHKDLDPRTAPLDEILEILREADVSDERRETILQGAPLTKAEVEVWQQAVRERAFDAQLVYECGAGNICVVLRVKHSAGRTAYIAARDWSGQSGLFVAVYSTYDEAVKALRNIGIVRIDDQVVFEDRYRRENE